MYVISSEGTAKRNWRRNKYVREMKLPKTRPWRQDVHGELLVGILLGPSAHGPGHADLAFPVGLEPLRNNRPAKQRSTVTSATAAVVVNIARDQFSRSFSASLFSCVPSSATFAHFYLSRALFSFVFFPPLFLYFACVTQEISRATISRASAYRDTEIAENSTDRRRYTLYIL